MIVARKWGIDASGMNTWLKPLYWWVIKTGVMGGERRAVIDQRRRSCPNPLHVVEPNLVRAVCLLAWILGGRPSGRSSQFGLYSLCLS